MRSTESNSHESLWRVPYRAIPGGRTMHKRGRERLVLYWCLGQPRKSGEGNPSKSMGISTVHLEDPDNDRHGKQASGRRPLSSSAHHLDMPKGPTDQPIRKALGGEDSTAAISAMRT